MNRDKKCDIVFTGKMVEALKFSDNITISEIVNNLLNSSFGGRDAGEAAELYKRMINDNDTIWLGVSGAIILAGHGGYISQLIEKGFVDVICSTGAQVYHDIHFAYNLPVWQGFPNVDDNELRKKGVVRIYDTYISEKDTLLETDKIVRDFVKKSRLKGRFSSADFNYALGKYILKNAPSPENSFVATAAKYDVPLFWDSLSNHSIAMNLAALYLFDKIDKSPNANLDILHSTAIFYNQKSNGFVELGGGGPKNFIQQNGPTLSQILGIDYEGADKGLQITTAVEKDGGLSGCTFNEAVTWGKYACTGSHLKQVWGDITIIFPIIVADVLSNCKERGLKRLYKKIPHYSANLMKKGFKIKL